MIQMLRDWLKIRLEISVGKKEVGMDAQQAKFRTKSQNISFARVLEDSRLVSLDHFLLYKLTFAVMCVRSPSVLYSRGSYPRHDMYMKSPALWM